MALFTGTLKYLLRGPVSGVSWPGAQRPDALTHRALREIRGSDYSIRSDLELRDILSSLTNDHFGTLPRKDTAGYERGSSDDTLPKIFAVINEAVSRRLGAWRLFDPDFDARELMRYQELAEEALECAPYKDRLSFYTDPDFLDSDDLAQCIEPLIEGMGLSEVEKIVVRAIVYVAEKSKVAYRPDVMLAAEFYRALSFVDTGGVLKFRATDEQLLAGLLLYRGRIVQMNAGEGKTIAAAFPAVAQVLQGKAVHVITANDYLAARDAEWLAPVYESLGLTVGAVLEYMGDEERKYVYGQQIVYGTLRQFGFDFLRDNIKLPPDEPVQGPLEVAIVDEADHALIDQAHTPLIITGEPIGNKRAFNKTRRAIGELVSLQAERVREIEAQARGAYGNPREWHRLLAKLLLADPDGEVLKRRFAEDPRAYMRASTIIGNEDFQADDDRLSVDLFYVVDRRLNSVMLTELGQQTIERRLGPIFDTLALKRRLASVEAVMELSLPERRRLGDRLRRRIFRQNNQVSQVYQMLRAFVLLKKDVDYLVTDGEIVLIDQLTGRTLPDSRYMRGLHAAIEAKEGVAVRPESETLAQTSVQGFIRQYPHVAGMTGTALDSMAEFGHGYGLTVVTVPPSQASMRTDHGARLYLNRRDKLAVIVDEVAMCQRVGRPVLVGTLTVGQSAEISRLLSRRGIEHSLLNAVTNSAEAETIRNAGAFGAVTIATNMAGRGTDIVLESGLSDRIVAAYLDLLSGLLSQNISCVELACATSQEADLIWTALSGCEEMVVTRMDKTGQPYRSVLTCSRASSEYLECDVTPFLSLPRCDGGENKVARSLGELAEGKGAVHPHGTTGGTIRLEFGLGLYVIGTEMNQSVRIDRQLRGRSGRQGAFGCSRFFLSLEDQLLAYRSDNSSCASGAPETDEAGRRFFDGPAVERHLTSVQSNVESDGEVHRSMGFEYARVLEAQTLAYYRARRQVIESDSFHEVCRRFVEQWAARLVQRYFPELRFDDYLSQFDRLAEELQADFEIDCSGLEGVGLHRLSDGIASLMLDRLDGARVSFGDTEFDNLEKLTFLQTSDEIWKVHLVEVQDLMASVSLGFHSHTSAVAEFSFRCFEAYQRFKDRVVDAYLPRILTPPNEGVIETQDTEIVLSKEVSRILV